MQKTCVITLCAEAPPFAQSRACPHGVRIFSEHGDQALDIVGQVHVRCFDRLRQIRYGQQIALAHLALVREALAPLLNEETERLLREAADP